MHIVHINLASGFSGGEQQTLMLIQQQLSVNMEITVVANPKSIFAKKIKKLGIEPILISHYLLGHTSNITSQADLVHVHEGRAIYWAYIQSIIYKTPYIITRRIDNPFKNKLFSRLAYLRASAVVGLSSAIMSQIEMSYPTLNKKLIPSSPVTYPVEAKTVNKIRAMFESKFIIIQASNLLKHKGHETTIKVARKIQPIMPDIQFVFLGDGKQMNALKEQAKDLKNVTFVGKKTNMGDWFEAADLFIHPSYSEGLGSVILEAMQSGTAVIASNAGGIPDIVKNNHTGLLVEAQQTEPLVAAIMSMKRSEQLRADCVRGANAMLTSFNIVQTSKQYQSLYEQVIIE